MSPFRDRAEQLFAFCYEGAYAPQIRIESDRAYWLVDPGEVWGTAGNHDKITRLVLAAHRFRIQVFLRPQDDKTKITLEDRGFAPGDPLEHHPGLADLVVRAYHLGGRRSDAELLAQTCTMIEDLLHNDESPNMGAYRIKWNTLSNEVKKR